MKRGNAPLDTRAIPKAPHSAFAAISYLYGDVDFTKFPRVLYSSGVRSGCGGAEGWRQSLGMAIMDHGNSQRPELAFPGHGPCGPAGRASDIDIDVQLRCAIYRRV